MEGKIHKGRRESSSDARGVSCDVSLEPRGDDTVVTVQISVRLGASSELFLPPQNRSERRRKTGRRQGQRGRGGEEEEAAGIESDRGSARLNLPRTSMPGTNLPRLPTEHAHSLLWI